eukprot:497328-Rhodomonas_salina.3
MGTLRCGRVCGPEAGIDAAQRMISEMLNVPLHRRNKNFPHRQSYLSDLPALQALANCLQGLWDSRPCSLFAAQPRCAAHPARLHP